MKKIKLAISVSILSVVSALVVAGSLVLSRNRTPDARALGEVEGQTLTLNSSSGNEFKYHYVYSSTNVSNYLGDDISFKYNRCYSLTNYFMVMCPGGNFFNEYISESENFNGLCGMDSITVNFASATGKLYLSYGLDENYYVTDEELTSGVAYSFVSFKPSHFRLNSLNDVNATNNVFISSIVVHYHSNNYYDVQEYEFTNVYTSSNVDNIASGGSKTYSLGNATINTNNYVNIRYKSSENLKGTLNYYDITNSRNVSEEVFLEASSYPIDFNTFLDSFRKGSVGSTNKRLTSLVLSNVGGSTSNTTIYSVGYCDRSYSRSDVLYISDSAIELGVSLQFAGSITSVKNLNQNIQEYVDSNYVIKIRGSDKHSGDVNNVIRNNPNLINIHDVGREVQQSWYINVGSDQGYTRGTYLGTDIPYNPVQAGDMNNNESQIVDYKLTYDENNVAKLKSIWIKTKALDWSKNNELTHSYMENTYSINDGLIRVKNRFIDFAGWTNYETNAGWPQGDYNTNGHAFLSREDAPLCNTQELPAFYTSHALDYFGTYFSDSMGSNSGKLIFDKYLGWNVGTTPIEHNNSDIQGRRLVADGSYNGETTYRMETSGGHYEFRKHTENWLGFFNEDHFGIALYMPANEYNSDANERHVFSAGMYNSSHEAATTQNRTYLDSNYSSKTASFSKGYTIGGKTYGKTDLTKDSCYVSNTGYFATILGLYVPNYSAMEYSYLIGADYMNTLRSKFASAQQSGTVYNDFTAWKGACI